MTLHKLRDLDQLPKIASVCHEANRQYCTTIGDYSQPAWDSAPAWQKNSAYAGVDFHLQALESGAEPPPSASHDSWLAQKRAEGWKYGPTKNPETKEHPCFVSYDQLPVEQRIKDYIFAAIVKAFFDAHGADDVA